MAQPEDVLDGDPVRGSQALKSIQLQATQITTQTADLAIVVAKLTVMPLGGKVLPAIRSLHRQARRLNLENRRYQRSRGWEFAGLFQKELRPMTAAARARPRRPLDRSPEIRGSLPAVGRKACLCDGEGFLNPQRHDEWRRVRRESHCQTLARSIPMPMNVGLAIIASLSFGDVASTCCWTASSVCPAQNPRPSHIRSRFRAARPRRAVERRPDTERSRVDRPGESRWRDSNKDDGAQIFKVGPRPAGYFGSWLSHPLDETDQGLLGFGHAGRVNLVSSVRHSKNDTVALKPRFHSFRHKPVLFIGNAAARLVHQHRRA